MLSFDQINHEKIEQLIESGVDINSIGTYNGNDSYTLLHAAIDNCDIESIKFILSKNPNVNALVKNYGPIDDDKDADDSDDDDDDDDNRNNDKKKMTGKYSKIPEKKIFFRDYSPLHIAVNKNRIDIVELLLANGADINVQIDNCHSVLNTAIKTGSIELIKYLLESGADINHISFFKIKPKKQTSYFDDNQISVKLRGFTPLYIATNCNRLEAVKLLIKKGANPNIEITNNLFVLILAVCNENYKIVEYLLEHGADVNCKQSSGYYIEYSALYFAIQQNRLDIVKLLVSYGAEVKDNGIAIFNAIELQHYEIVKFLIKHGFDVNVEEKDGYSEIVPLNAALDQSYFEIIELLLMNGADMNCPITPDEGIFHIYWICEKNKMLKQYILKVKVLKKHTGYLENVDLSASEVSIPIEHEDDEHKDKDLNLCLESYKEECEKEIQKMKTEMIGTSCLSYYELLRKNIYQLGMYAKNTSIATVLSDNKLEKKFPIYAHIIQNCFQKGVLRKELLEQVEKQLPDIFSKLFPSVRLEIFSYLKYDDLKYFIKYLNDN